MKKLLQAVFILSAVVLLSLSCKSKQNISVQSWDPKMNGVWTVHWLKRVSGENTDVTYVDTVEIKSSPKGNIYIECINRDHYIYDQIVFRKDTLTFRVENTIDPHEKFFIHYTLKLNKKQKVLSGRIKNSRGIEVYVELRKKE